MREISPNKYFLYYCWCVFALMLATQLVFAQPVRPLGRAMIVPSIVELGRGKKQQFIAVMIPTRLNPATVAREVKWSVNGIPGGNKDVGTINSSGLYKASKNVPSPRGIHICAKVKEAANRYLWATVLIDGQRPSYKTLWEWSEAIDDSKHLNDPHGIALEADGNILIADMGASRVLRFSATGKYLGEIGLGPGNKVGHFSAPRDVTVHPTGNIFVSDERTGPPRIQVFNPDGVHLYSFAQKGVGPGQILRTQGLGFDEEHKIYTADIDNMRINIYDSSSAFLYSLGREGINRQEFNAPHGVVIDANGDLFVPSFYSPCQKLTAEGKILFEFAHAIPPHGPVYIYRTTGDRWGNVYLSVRGARSYSGEFKEAYDENGKRVNIMKYNNHGDYITGIQLSKQGREAIQAVVNESGRVYVLFKGQRRMGVEVLIEQ